MPRYDYRNIGPTLEAQKTFLQWIERLDSEFANKDPGHRSDVVRDALHEIYLARPYADPEGTLAGQSLVHGFDPRNATLEPEYYGDVDAAKYAERKPLIWFWMMYDRSPLGLNHWLGFRMRAMLARHVFKHCGKNAGAQLADPVSSSRPTTSRSCQLTASSINPWFKALIYNP